LKPLPLIPVKTNLRLAGLKCIALILALLAFQGMDCSEHQTIPSLATIRLKEIHLQILDPATGTLGVYLAWDHPADGKASYYEIYHASKLDSLKHPQFIQPATDSPLARITLPDSSRPMTLYFAIRSVWVEPTGQKLIGDTLAIDSIKVLPSSSILAPGTGSVQVGRNLHIEVETGSDPGILLYRYLYEKNGSKWLLKQQACLPAEGCNNPIFGRGFQREDLVLEQVAVGDTIPSLFCVLGTESFEGYLTGLIQSLSCSRYIRVHE
jgi:hypothetical protein